MKGLKYFLSLAMLMCGVMGLRAQDTKIVYAAVIEGDTIPYYHLQEVEISGLIAYLTPDEIRKNQRLIRNVKKVLPYAKMGKERLDQIERKAASMSERDRAQYIKKMEKDLLAEFTDELKALTISQGKVLLKMVDRETNRTAYMLVDEMRGRLRAGFYNTFAKIFGYNMKKRYDPLHNKEDNLLERVILSVEAGRV